MVTWYTSIALLASHMPATKAASPSVLACGFCSPCSGFSSSVLAGLAGIEVGSTASTQWVQFEAVVDLLSQMASTITSSNSAWMTSTLGSAPSGSRCGLGVDHRACGGSNAA